MRQRHGRLTEGRQGRDRYMADRQKTAREETDTCQMDRRAREETETRQSDRGQPGTVQ